MQPRERAIPLKRGAKRSVERSAGPGTEVVKRFHSPGRFDRLRDRSRAVSEYKTLRELAERDLPVPRPIAVRHTARGWELATEWIEGAVPLSDVLAGRATWPAPAEALVRSLGALLARAHTLGLDHPDLHSGNVLVDAGARAWLVDVHGARLTSRPSARVAIRDLVQLAADLRERLSLGLRARALAAWRAGLPSALVSQLPAQPELARRIEHEARLRRRTTIERARLRWTRNSSSCRTHTAAGFSGFVSVELGACDPLLFRTPAAPSEWSVTVFDGAPSRELRMRWYAAARLGDHGLRCARPLVLSRSPSDWAAFGLPRAARPLPRVLDEADEPTRRAIAGSLGDLAGTLFDRGLCAPELATESLFVDEHGALWLGPIASIEELDFAAHPLSIGGGRWPAALRAALSTASERLHFASAFVRAQRSGGPTRSSVRTALGAALGVRWDG